MKLSLKKILLETQQGPQFYTTIHSQHNYEDPKKQLPLTNESVFLLTGQEKEAFHGVKVQTIQIKIINGILKTWRNWISKDQVRPVKTEELPLEFLNSPEYKIYKLGTTTEPQLLKSFETDLRKYFS